MKKMMVISLIVVFIGFTTALWASDVYVRGHYKDSNGDGVKDTYVEPYHRTSPDSTKTNNYSYPGNSNPYKYK